MKKEDITLLLIPFLMSALIIFGHYRLLVGTNPNAHSRPLIGYSTVQSLDEKDLTPQAPTTTLPKEPIGIMSEIPTNSKALTDIKDRLSSNASNILILRVGIKINSLGKLIVTRTEEVEDKTLIRWLKKTASEIQAKGYHIYLLFNLEEDPIIQDFDAFLKDYSEILATWSDVAQQYFISFLDPGLFIGSQSYESLPNEIKEQLKKSSEQIIRKYYTGRIGIEMCCNVVETNTAGYNYLSVLSVNENLDPKYQQQLLSIIKKNKLEYLFYINTKNNTIKTIMRKA
jgi:hypothetical protein